MAAPAIIVALGVGIGSSGLAAAVSNPPHTGTDYVGIAGIIAAVASLIGTIGGLIIAFKKRTPNAPPPPQGYREIDAVIELIKEVRGMDDDEHSDKRPHDA